MRRVKFLSEQEFIKLSICDVAAITGPMAAGKNYICNQLEKLNFVSIDADEVVHDAIADVTPEILSTFNKYADARGVVLTNPDGTLNRRTLGTLVFADETLLAKQEAIVYPAITKKINNFIKANPDKKILINATVLYKIPALMDECQLILYVTAPLFTRINRVKNRDHLPLKQILNRFHNQRNLLKKYEATGKEIIVINNKKN